MHVEYVNPTGKIEEKLLQMSNKEEKDKNNKLCIQYIYGPAWVGIKELITILHISKWQTQEGICVQHDPQGDQQRKKLWR